MSWLLNTCWTKKCSITWCTKPIVQKFRVRCIDVKGAASTLILTILVRSPMGRALVSFWKQNKTSPMGWRSTLHIRFICYKAAQVHILLCVRTTQTEVIVLHLCARALHWIWHWRGAVNLSHCVHTGMWTWTTVCILVSKCFFELLQYVFLIYEWMMFKITNSAAEHIKVI